MDRRADLSEMQANHRMALGRRYFGGLTAVFRASAAANISALVDIRPI